MRLIRIMIIKLALLSLKNLSDPFNKINKIMLKLTQILNF